MVWRQEEKSHQHSSVGSHRNNIESYLIVLKCLNLNSVTKTCIKIKTKVEIEDINCALLGWPKRKRRSSNITPFRGKTYCGRLICFYSKIKYAISYTIYRLPKLVTRYACRRMLKNRIIFTQGTVCLLYTSPSPRDRQKSRMPSSA